ncbi:MAG: hypothetical protein JWO66_2939, partial [Candidatus Eremiobacteraeota bacterium]|nr:hypothetical protein [Candidatus Eremiobacteraeota bacterium]
RRDCNRYPLRHVGGSLHPDYLIPGEDIRAFNDAIVGRIEVIESYQTDA